MYKKSRQGWFKHIDFMVIDLLCLQASLVLAYFLYMKRGWNLYADDEWRSIAIVIGLTDILVTVLFNTLHNILRRKNGKEFLAMIKHAVLSFLLVSLYLFSIKQSALYSRVTVYLTYAFDILLAYGLRVLWKHRLHRHTRREDLMSMLLVTSEANAVEVINELQSISHAPYEIKGIVLTDAQPVADKIQGLPVVSSLENAASYICREWIDEVYLCAPEGTALPEQLIADCTEMGVTVHIMLNVKSGHNQNQFVEQIADHMVLTGTIAVATPLQAFLKRLMDIVGGFFGSLVALLVIAIIGPIIKKKSPGPIIFAQERIGKNGKRFKFYKIRSMVTNADAIKKDLMEKNRVADGMMFKLDWDPRIIGNVQLPDGTKKTGIGELIRKTSLDEFPQFFNVLKGDMSLVGTRPPTVDEWEKYEYHHRARLAMKPGITGMWQVSGRSNITDFEEVVKLDTDYIHNWSIGLDLRILVKTLVSVFKHEGAM